MKRASGAAKTAMSDRFPVVNAPYFPSTNDWFEAPEAKLLCPLCPEEKGEPVQMLPRYFDPEYVAATPSDLQRLAFYVSDDIGRSFISSRIT